ncbi:hypothetical protein TVAG_422620 [Trichomonas vaginalis G3]|uniref:Uncharacterized protein n=1 Tax=Trichomonas vaginalis (strain ATCC PRA-98 / G3) TaxID=412133 RepID=A2G405_TRIV3|nr:hypothetical protein TVAGG3_0408830 [Trichomonas vaginalis G3]EAX88107.1 hypothetical protein TVAG_422620 [Trichomonas vaginalis G3]KAI5535210.1 hypothetical protein TVAGG3_0408830 [Trichomonas vaginalis G3]|eukprot:XP_001301037.1 hypothetical protein [Trichomonas vaginalis G3]
MNFLNLTALFTRAAEKDLRKIIQGNWTVSIVDLNSAGVQKNDDIEFNITINNETDSVLSSNFVAEDINYECKFNFNSNTSFDFELTNSDGFRFDQSFDIVTHQENARTATGFIPELQSTFSLNILGDTAAEFSLYNTNTMQVRIIRLVKTIPRKRNLLWLAPSAIGLVFLVIKFIYDKNRQQKK